HGRVAFHNAHASGGPAKDEIRIEALTRHCVVTRSRRVIHCQNNLRNSRSRHRFDKLSPGTNDPGVLSVRSDHESGDILHEQQRRLMPVAGLDEVSDLLSGFRIDDPTEARRFSGHAHHASMIRNYANLNSADTTVTRDHLFRVVSLKLIEMTIVEQTLHQLFN